MTSHSVLLFLSLHDNCKASYLSDRELAEMERLADEGNVSAFLHWSFLQESGRLSTIQAPEQCFVAYMADMLMTKTRYDKT
jgi:hypothetical protein